ncbi:unnamed protein product [Parascedosporium putredinis]|uniref:Peptidase M20 domain-containing protein 2 n=1 Tax=Parascedosporium putredinis TaxID=1442378 RepID=A0A9P1H0G2_9PEZI|nr:unnamed protein product [Parascedosporium putredinis]CAI7993920.1 unnamed protein product [Parascedosporium putredinis]
MTLRAVSSNSLLALGLAFCLAGLVPALPQRRADTETSPYVTEVSDYIDSISEELWEINTEIHSNPELGFEEVIAHQLLTDYMSEQDGWTVERSAYNISTAFVAVFEGSGDGPVVSFNAEYALATAHIMREHELPGRVVLYGTPAEEGGAGKVRLLEAGAYADQEVDISLISHPSNLGDTPFMSTTANEKFFVEYFGSEAHAANSPWEGLNAQDAIVLAYNALSMLRQQSETTEIIHGIITSGGSRMNIIPSYASGEFGVRAPTTAALQNLTERVRACFEAGALATGTELNFTMLDNGYAEMINNVVLAHSYTNWFQGLGGEVVPEQIARATQGAASTDQGNVSQEIPSISVLFLIENEDGSIPESGPHTEGFEVAAGTRRAFDKSLMVAKALAGVALDILTVDGLLEAVQEEFENTERAAPTYNHGHGDDHDHSHDGDLHDHAYGHRL